MYLKNLLCVKVDKHLLTDTFPSNIGVRQGDNLSPNFFKIFINDLPKCLLDTPDPAVLNHTRLDCLMYADDVVLLSASSTGLQQKLDNLNKLCNDWCLTVNVSKSKVLIFNKSGRCLNGSYSIQNQALECVSSYKYPGVIFSASGSFRQTQNYLYKKGLKALFMLKNIFNCLHPGISTSMHVFDHTIKPILLYGSECWGSFRGKNFDQTFVILPHYRTNLNSRNYTLCTVSIG